MMTEELPRTKNSKYPWDEWIKKGEVTIERGVDFDVDVEVMRNLATRSARRRKS